MNKPKKGPCENCPADRKRTGRRRGLTPGGEKYVLRDEHARATGAKTTIARRGRHLHGGKPGKVV